MDYLSQEEDLQFFDANDEMMMMASNPSGFGFDIWNDSPGSVVERRRKFLEWMGVEQDGVQSKELVSAANEESGFDGAQENSVEAEERRSGGFSSSSSDVSSSGSSVEVSEELSLRVDKNVGGCDVTRRQSSSMASCSNSRYCQVKETEKQGSIAGLVTNFKKGWFTRLRSMGCTADTKVESSGRLRASSSFGDVISRVKVKQCKKQAKELSALYQSQDIKAHDGAILAMKFSGDGKFLASSGEDGIVRVWKVVEDKRSRLRRDGLNEIDPSSMYFEVNDLSQLKPVLVDEEKSKKATESFRKTSDSACVVFPSKVFRIMDKPLYEFRGHTGEVLDISWSKDNYLISASMDKTVRLWKVGSNDCLGVFPHNSYVTSVQFNPVNENYFMSGSIDGKVRIWNISGCNVTDWADLKDIISAVCYRPDGQGGIIGCLTGSCRFFSMSGEYLELDSQIHLHNKKKSSNKRITGFQYLPQEQNKVLVVSADSKVRILQGNNVIRKYKGVCKTRSLTSASLTSDGKHIVSACEDSNVYIWSNDDESDCSSQSKKIRSFERFSTNASVAATWSGFSDHNTTLPFSSPSCLSLNEGYVPGSISKGSATWPEENLPVNPLSTSAMNASHYKFIKSSYQRASSSLSWGMVIVTGGWDGRIRTFQNYGLPVTT
ncbi:PREDICTED: WD repeat-containing protein 44-like [Camelina sativa]|uniref:WD repeat-containing protein 44-like n=1 Tax=Camelina sativa TaxID=90675 RepID=A0ABM0UT25_CAMSA|nr:PREDICTED: WD repeat-containing protein 44-like [Camelina sativa]XP_010445867.1 PREDICTED: WD repeat-containing protein 44-like [Camelina sativa]XP_010445872.1 PREDICTED: WD repeat-containing protein 44-like [Camelina sativa]